jgi:hypothetical protein
MKHWLGCGGNVTVCGEARRSEERSTEYVIVTLKSQEMHYVVAGSCWGSEGRSIGYKYWGEVVDGCQGCLRIWRSLQIGRWFGIEGCGCTIQDVKTQGPRCTEDSIQVLTMPSLTSMSILRSGVDFPVTRHQRPRKLTWFYRAGSRSRLKHLLHQFTATRD